MQRKLNVRAAGKLRDRDVQGARNILWIGINMYYGLDRPEYLRRKLHAPDFFSQILRRCDAKNVMNGKT